MEKLLAALFDFQHFEQNRSLREIIEATEANYPASVEGAELEDDDLLILNAAGIPTAARTNRNDERKA